MTRSAEVFKHLLKILAPFSAVPDQLVVRIAVHGLAAHERHILARLRLGTIATNAWYRSVVTKRARL